MNPARLGGIAGLVVLTATIAWLTAPPRYAHSRAAWWHRGGHQRPRTHDTARRHGLRWGSGSRRTIRVVNDDTVKHQLAMFTIPAGGRTDYTVPPGTFGGVCSAHPTNTQLTFVIR